MMGAPANVMTDFGFLAQRVKPRQHYLYVYNPDSALLRAQIRRHVTAYAKSVSWNPMGLRPGGTLHGILASPSSFDDRFYVCDGSAFTLNDLEDVMLGIADDAFDSHLCLTISARSALQSRESWRKATDHVGVIVEPTVTVENYRGITRRLLDMSDLRDVRHFGDDAAFLSRMKAFVQNRQTRWPFEFASEMDRIILTEAEGGIVRQSSSRHDDAHDGGKLSELIARFLDGRASSSLNALLKFIGITLQSVNDPERLLVRLLKATAKIVAGADRRYKRNREGNPAVVPYLIWATMLLRAERALRGNHFVVVFEQLCQAYHAEAVEAAAWFIGPSNWQDAVHAMKYGLADRPTELDRGREDLRSALRSRVRASDIDELRWLVRVASEAESECLSRATAARA